jgi:hypothetical protein
MTELTGMNVSGRVALQERDAAVESGCGVKSSPSAIP